MAEVSQRQPPPTLILGHGSSAVKGLADLLGVGTVDVVVVPVVSSGWPENNLVGGIGRGVA
jgi:hypothetical protein